MSKSDNLYKFDKFDIAGEFDPQYDPIPPEFAEISEIMVDLPYLLKKSQRYQNKSHSAEYQFLNVTFNPSKFISEHHPISFHYAQFLHSFNTNETIYQSESDLNDLIRSILHNMRLNVDRIAAEKNKNTGSANRRRSAAIQAYKSNKSDFTTLLTSIRAAISSTMRERAEIANQMGDEDRIAAFNPNQPIYYKSYSYLIDLHRTLPILNQNIAELYQLYQIAVQYITQFNELVLRFEIIITPD